MESHDTTSSQFSSRLRALLAPVASNRGAAIDDPQLLDIAAQVVAAFVRGDTTGGLSRAQIAGRIGSQVPAEQLETRLNLFVEMGMLKTFHGRRHEQRYRLSSISVVGMLVYQRLQQRGGIDELRTLLDRARRLLQDTDHIDHDTVAAEIAKLTGLLNVFADELELLTDSAPLGELIAERRMHDHSDLISDVQELNQLVTDHAPELDRAAVALIGAAQGYLAAVQRMVERIFEDGGETRDFSVLNPEDYYQAAKTATVAELAAVFDRIVFDAASLHIDPAQLADDLSSRRPVTTRKLRPPEPPAPTDTTDPLTLAEQRRARATERRIRRAEQLLDGADETDLTGWMTSAGWRGTAETIADLAALDTDTDQPYLVETGAALLVDHDAEPTYRAPTVLQAQRPPVRDQAHDIPVERAAQEAADG